jgi:integrase
MKKTLTQTVVRSLKILAVPYRVWDSGPGAVEGLFVNVGKTKKTYYFKFRDKIGKQYNHRLGDADVLTTTQARELAITLKGRLIRGDEPEHRQKNIYFGDFIRTSYGAWVTDNRKTGQETLDILCRNFDWLFQNKISGITRLLLENWRTEQRRKGTKCSSINRYMAALQAALNWGVEQELIDVNPLEKIKPLKEVDSVQKVRYLSDEERTRLWIALNNREEEIRGARSRHGKWSEERKYGKIPEFAGEFTDYLRPMVILSLYTGIRRGNVFGLLWGDIDFAAKTITLRADETKNSKTYHVPLNDFVISMLEAWKAQSGDTSLSSLVFPSPKTGERLDNCKTAWAHLMKRAEIENFRWHDMRHDFASQLVMDGVDLNTVRELLGHADIKMTLRYAHLAPSVKSRAVERLPKLHDTDSEAESGTGAP